MKDLLAVAVVGVAVALVALMIVVGGSRSFRDAYDCHRRLSVAKRVETQEALRSWVRENVVGRHLGKDDVKPRMGLGDRLVDAQFDWRTLGYGKYANVSLVGSDYEDWKNDTIAEHSEAVLFTEMSRAGIVVRLLGKSSFGLDPKVWTITPVADDVAVFCGWAD